MHERRICPLFEEKPSVIPPQAKRRPKGGGNGRRPHTGGAVPERRKKQNEREQLPTITSTKTSDMLKPYLFAIASMLFCDSMIACTTNDSATDPDWNAIPAPGKTDPPAAERTIEPSIEPAAADADTTGLRYRPGMQINVSDASFAARLDEVAEAGFEYIELKFKFSYGFERRTDAEIAATLAGMRRRIDEKNITVWSVHLPYDSTEWTNIGGAENVRRQSVDYLLRVLRLCHEQFPGCRNYVLHASKGVLKPRSASVAQARKSLEEMLPAADRYGVRLCIENLVGSLCPTPEEKGAVIDGFDNARTTFDIGHANCTGHDVVEFLKWEGTRLGTVHIHDTMFGTRNDDHRLVGQGDIARWGDVYRTLLAVNRYRGVFLFEPTDTQKAADVMATYRTILDAYRREAK